MSLVTVASCTRLGGGVVGVGVNIDGVAGDRFADGVLAGEV